MGPEIVVPVAVFGTILAIVWAALHYSAKKRIEAYATVRVAIEKGQQVTPEAMEAMTRLAHPLADLRRGIILIAVTFAIVGFAMVIGTEEEEALRPLLAIAIFPLTVGLAYIGLHYFANDKKPAR